MPTKQAIFTNKAFHTIPSVYSQAIVANGTVYCSGVIGVDPETGMLIEGNVQDRTHRIIQNISQVLEAAGASLLHAVKVNVFLTDMSDFEKMNEVYSTYWGDVKPCRTCVAVKQLPFGTDIEIECIAILP